ncbi:hypothetical protein HDU97_004011 [Phlyctochytrium planicorne]|nr:hypothetical protein HDU97_004011 [Phlyctochytrium planicorne]
MEFYDDDEVSWGPINPKEYDDVDIPSRRDTLLLPPAKRHCGMSQRPSLDRASTPDHILEDVQLTDTPPKSSIILIQRCWRRFALRRSRETNDPAKSSAIIGFQIIRRAALCIQRWWRRMQSRIFVTRRETAAIRLQSFFKMVQTRSKYQQTRNHVVLLQSFVRTALQRKQFSRIKTSTLAIQKWWKRKRLQKQQPKRRPRRAAATKSTIMEEKKKALQQIRQKRLQLQKQLTSTAPEPQISPPMTSTEQETTASPLPIASAAESTSIPKLRVSRRSIPKSESKTPVAAVHSSTPTPSATEESPIARSPSSSSLSEISAPPLSQPLPSEILSKLNVKQLALITQNNTRRNDGMAFCTLNVEVVVKEEPPPPSPSERLKQQMSDRGKEKVVEDECIMDEGKSGKVRWRETLREHFDYDPNTIICPPSKKFAKQDAAAASHQPPPAPLKTCLKPPPLLAPQSTEAAPRKIVVTVQRIVFQSADTVVPEPIPVPLSAPAPVPPPTSSSNSTPRKAPAPRKTGTPGPSRVSKRTSTPAPKKNIFK